MASRWGGYWEDDFAIFSRNFLDRKPDGCGKDSGYNGREVSTDMRTSLDKDFTEVEMKEALFQMHPDKAPRLDGMTVLFYQKYWHLVGHEIIKVILIF